MSLEIQLECLTCSIYLAVAAVQGDDPNVVGSMICMFLNGVTELRKT